MKLIIEINEDDYTMCQILAKEMCDTRLKLTDNLKYAISNGTPLDKIRAEIEGQKECRCFDDDDMFIYRTGLDDALDIIDKYREGEQDETNN